MGKRVAGGEEMVRGRAAEAGGSSFPAGGDGQAPGCHRAWDGDEDGTPVSCSPGAMVRHCRTPLLTPLAVCLDGYNH